MSNEMDYEQFQGEVIHESDLQEENPEQGSVQNPEIQTGVSDANRATVSGLSVNASPFFPPNPSVDVLTGRTETSISSGISMPADVPSTHQPVTSAAEVEELVRRYLMANNLAQTNPMSIIGSISDMLRTNIKPFDPSEPAADPLNFVRNFERFSDGYHWDEKNVKFQFGNHLVGSANKWFNDQNWKNQSWIQIRTRFLSKFSEQKLHTGLDDLFQLNYEDNPSEFIDSLAKAYNDIVGGGELLTQVISVGFRKLPSYLAQHFAVDCPENFETFGLRLKKLTNVLKPRKQKVEVSTSNPSRITIPSVPSPKKAKLAPWCPRHKQIGQEVRHWINECTLPPSEAPRTSSGQKRSFPNSSTPKNFAPKQSKTINLVEQPKEPKQSAHSYELPEHLRPR